MKTGFFRHLALGLLILALLVWLLDRSRMVDTEEHSRYLATISQLQELEVAVNEIILRSRHAYLANYDPLVAVNDRLRKAAAELAMLPRFLSAGDREELRPLLAVYVGLLARREELSERFKSDNAVLHNSLSFFPVAATELAERMRDEKPRLAADLQDILRDLFMYNLYSYPELLPRLHTRLADFRHNMTRSSSGTNQQDLERNLGHAEVIIRYKRQLDQTTIDNLNLPTRAALQDIHHRYQQAYLRALVTANNYRLALYLTAIVLAAGIAYAMIRYYNSGVALRLANEGLEEKVRQRTEELRRLAMTDELTGLYARRFLFGWLEKELAAIRRRQRQLSCLLLDADHFKRINDTFGHAEGDLVLQKIAATIRNCIREADIAGRFGGEEFLVLLPETSREDAALVAEKIRRAIAAITVPTPLSASIGVATCDCRAKEPGTGNTGEMITYLLMAADQAMYRAKEGGRNRVCCAEEAAAGVA